MDAIERIVKLLDDESPRKRIAAAVVLGELKVKDAQVVSRIVQMAKDPVEAYAEAAVEALGQLHAMKALQLAAAARRWPPADAGEPAPQSSARGATSVTGASGT